MDIQSIAKVKMLTTLKIGPGRYLRKGQVLEPPFPRAVESELMRGRPTVQVVERKAQTERPKLAETPSKPSLKIR
jgi:hypothetical protein